MFHANYKEGQFNTIHQLLEAGGANFMVGAEGLRTESGQKVEGWKVNKRMDTGAILGVVKDSYKIVQNEDALSLAQTLRDISGCKLARAGTIKGGALVFLQLEMPGQLVVPGKGEAQNVSKLLTFRTSHNGVCGITGSFWGGRIVCQNTFMFAWTGRDKAMGSFSVRHTRNADAALKSAADIMKVSESTFAGMQKGINLLASTKFTDAQMATLSANMAPADENGVVSSRAQGVRDELERLFTMGRGHESIRGTAWAAFNAVTEYVDHHRSTRAVAGRAQEEARLESAWFGSGANLKDEALKSILSQAELVQAWGQ